jgi:RNA polymerase sigma-70 factor (ECF subfamily)
VELINFEISMAVSNSTPPPRGDNRFPPTHWTIVVEAGKDSSPEARAALGQLYRTYQPTLIGYLRSGGKSEEEAEELVQGFFESLLEHRGLSKVRREGKFRSWLLASLKNYLYDQWDRTRAAKRGGGQPHEALHTGNDDQPAVDPPYPGPTPDQEFDRRFAIRFLELVMERLEQEYHTRGRARLFDEIRAFLLDKKGDLPHAQVAARLGMSETAINAEVSRMRKRFRAVFDRDLANLVERPDELEVEKQFLFAALRA